MYLYKNQKGKLLDFEICGEDQNDFRIHLDRDLLMTEGKELIKKFLLILQTYKSSGCVERGKVFYDEHSAVDEKLLKIREIVVKNKKPRRIELNNNFTRYNQSSIEVQSYPENFEGLIASFADRYSAKKEAIE